MAELERKEEQEKVPAPVKKREQKVKQEQSEQAEELGEQFVAPRRWYMY